MQLAQRLHGVAEKLLIHCIILYSDIMPLSAAGGADPLQNFVSAVESTAPHFLSECDKLCLCVLLLTEYTVESYREQR